MRSPSNQLLCPHPEGLGPVAHLHSLQPWGAFHARWTVGWTLERQSRQVVWSPACASRLAISQTLLEPRAAAPPHPTVSTSKATPPLPHISPAPGPRLTKKSALPSRPWMVPGRPWEKADGDGARPDSLPPQACAKDSRPSPCGKSEDTYRFARWPRGPRWPLWSRVPLEARGAQIILLSGARVTLPPPPVPATGLSILSSRSQRDKRPNCRGVAPILGFPERPTARWEWWEGLLPQTGRSSGLPEVGPGTAGETPTPSLPSQRWRAAGQSEKRRLGLTLGPVTPISPGRPTGPGGP